MPALQRGLAIVDGDLRRRGWIPQPADLTGRVRRLVLVLGWLVATAYLVELALGAASLDLKIVAGGATAVLCGLWWRATTRGSVSLLEDAVEAAMVLGVCLPAGSIHDMTVVFMGLAVRVLNATACRPMLAGLRYALALSAANVLMGSTPVGVTMASVAYLVVIAVVLRSGGRVLEEYHAMQRAAEIVESVAGVLAGALDVRDLAAPLLDAGRQFAGLAARSHLEVKLVALDPEVTPTTAGSGVPEGADADQADAATAGDDRRAVCDVVGQAGAGYRLTVVGDGPVAASIQTGMDSLAQLAAIAIRGVEARRELASRRAEDRFRQLVEHSSDVITVVDRELGIRFASPSINVLLGIPADEIVGRSLADFVDPDDMKKLAPVMRWAFAAPGQSARFEARIRDGSGAWHVIEAAITGGRAGSLLDGAVLNARDVTERRALEEQLVHQAFHDPLTGIANRALFADRTAHALARSAREASQVAVLFLDLDRFKAINDLHGHGVGDEVLRAVSERLTAAVRAADTVARMGGDEFAILLESGGDEGDAVKTAHRVLEALEPVIATSAGSLRIGASVGAAIARPGTDADQLVRDADVAMYEVKAAGQPGFLLYDPVIHGNALEARRLELDLREAVERDELCLQYQPTVDLRTGTVTGVESLVRWQHPVHGLLPPARFIPLAERSGVIAVLGAWVLRRACLDLAAMRLAGHVSAEVTVAVNVSARQLDTPRIIDDVGVALAESGLPADRLVIELTESMLARDPEVVLARLAELRAIGVRLAIDDFGTGYSSLSYLRRLPVEVVKIDRSFIEGVTAGSRSAALVQAMLDMSRSLNLATVAEGIERPEQLTRLRALGCDVGQGFLFAHPVDLADLHAAIDHAQAIHSSTAVTLGNLDDEEPDARRVA